MKKPGFTLVEVLVSMGLLLTFVSLGLASFQTNNNRQKQVLSFEEFKQVLQLAKNNAATGKKPDTCTAPLLGWRVRFTSSTYTIEVICATFYPDPLITPYLARTETLPSGVTISVVPPSVNEVVFRPLGQGTVTNIGPTIAPSVVITVQDSVSQNSVTITDKGGIQ